MAISVANIKTAYDTYVTAATAAANALIAIQGLGPRPTFPTIVITDADYNNVVTAQGTWDGSYATNLAAYEADVVTARSAELAVINVIQTGSGVTKGANEWFKLVGAGAGPLTYTNWIAYSSIDTNPNDDLPYLVIATVQPTKPFSNSTNA